MGLAVLNTSYDARLAHVPLRLDSRYVVMQNPLALGQGCAVFFVAAVDQLFLGAGGDCPFLADLCHSCLA